MSFLVGVLASLLASLLAACSDRSAPASSLPPPPPVDFLMSAGDSTFWVTGTRGGLRTRGAPIVIASWGGRFYEIYVTDDDRSFEDAVFVGQRLYRRDLATNDSLMVFVDTAAPRAAARYAEANPSARPLAPDEEGAEDPPVATTAEVDVMDVYGPYLSFEYHVDVRDPGTESWHSTRRAVVDLRSGKPVSLRDLFGAGESKRLSDAGRAEFLATLDSVRAAVAGGGGAGAGESARRAVSALPDFHFDPSSFSLADVDGRPTVDFAAPGTGAGGAGFTLPLLPLNVRDGDAAAGKAWWDSVRITLPLFERNGAELVWRRDGYRVVARSDSVRADADDDATATVAVADAAREWPAGRITGPIRSVFWLDRPPADSVQRRALLRAFEEAAMYDERTRSTMHMPDPTPEPIRLATSVTSHRSVVRRAPSNARHNAARPRHSR